MQKNRNVESDIINAARIVFQEKGYKEATMRDIAAKASINLAMLHYYFRSKDNLFFLVFDESLHALYENIVRGISNPDLDIFEKIRIITHEYIGFFNGNPAVPPFIMGEIIRNPAIIGKKLMENVQATHSFRLFAEQLQAEIDKGMIIQISAVNLILNILSLCMFPALARPVIEEIFCQENTGIETMLNARKIEVSDFIIRAIKA